MSIGNELIAVFITVPSDDCAKKLSRTLVEQRLCACVNIIPGITSIYRWKGQIEEGSELLLIAKTTRLRYEELEQAIVAAHPYDTPEIVAVKADKVFEKYAAWLLTETL